MLKRLWIIGLLASLSVPAVDAEESTDRLFTLKILPVLRDKCFGCHGAEADDIRGDYDLTSRARLLAGGESGEAAVIPGNSEGSPLYQAILWEGYEMPPKENDRLTEEQVGHFREWIDAGAPWPGEETRKAIMLQERSVAETDEGIIVPGSGGLSDDWTYRRYQKADLWAFQPISAPELPGKQVVQPVDYFIHRRLAESGLAPAPQADSAVLLRRVTLDLTGLPPRPSEVEAFEAAWRENSDKAWEAAVDRLLASPHYGERQAQHWLDVVRYADTAGFSNDYERSNAWRYRDYVIRSMNADKPFRDFIQEQLAGDEIRPGDSEAIVATGYLRMGPWGTAMVPKDEARQLYVDDLVHNVGQTFLAMPMRCCKCHDHKFDPIPTRDYYSMYAVFAGTQPAEVPAPFSAAENTNRFAENRELVQELLDFAREELRVVNDKQEAAARAWYAEHGLPYKNEKGRKNDPEDQKPPRHVGLTPEEKGIKKVREQDVWIWERRLERYEPMAQSVYNGPVPRFLNSRKLRRPGKVESDWRPESYILAGGALAAPLDAVGPGVLSALGVPVDAGRQNGWEIRPDLVGRRSELASWIANDRNPLTARVIVNRIWQSHFGTGLVRTSNNFGAKGSKPSHPELLDWLAADFMRNGWTMKRLHRMIVLSETYRRSAAAADVEQQAAVDPDNRLLASFPPRRLTAEELRDSVLQMTGELNREMGGVPVMPEINMEVALQPRMIQFSIAPAHQPSRTPAERNRRTIYTYRVRGQADPFLEIMNLPNPNESCELRDSAAVTPQAFTLLNSDVMTDRSVAMAVRIINEQPGDTDRQLDQAFSLAFHRQPRAQEREMLSGYLRQMNEYHRAHVPEAVEYPREVVRSLVEEFTGEPFEFIEKLNSYDDYTPDAKPWTVSPEVRAMADVCLLLLNSNEFLYVY